MKILVTVYLKHSSLWPSANVNPVSNDLAHAIPWQCMFALSLPLSISLCLLSILKSLYIYSTIILRRGVTFEQIPHCQMTICQILVHGLVLESYCFQRHFTYMWRQPNCLFRLTAIWLIVIALSEHLYVIDI